MRPECKHSRASHGPPVGAGPRLRLLTACRPRDRVAGMNVRSALLALAALLAAACAPRLIPGTDVRDTSANRAVYDVLLKYREALEKRDAEGVMALVAPAYYDTAGTPDPADDLDRGRLEASLRQDLAKTESVKVDFTIRRIDVNGDDAQAEIFFDTFYRVKTPTTVV